jgi:hypothetical protein
MHLNGRLAHHSRLPTGMPIRGPRPRTARAIPPPPLCRLSRLDPIARTASGLSASTRTARCSRYGPTRPGYRRCNLLESWRTDKSTVADDRTLDGVRIDTQGRVVGYWLDGETIQEE